MRPVFVLALSLQLLVGCTFFPQAYTDEGCCGDSIWYSGIRYSAYNELFFHEFGRPIGDSDLGAEVFRIRGTFKGRTYVGFGPNLPTDGGDGEASVVPTGTPVSAVRGYAPTFRLAARHDGRLVRYEADRNPAAMRGVDVLDLKGNVVGISVLGGASKATPYLSALARVTDSDRVRELVELVLAAPVGQSYYTSGSYALVGFELEDGTVTARWYAHEPGVFTTFGGPRAGGYTIWVSGAFSKTIEELCRATGNACGAQRGG